MRKIKILTLIFILLLSATNVFAKNPSKRELDKYLETNTLVIIKDGNMKFSKERGISPLIKAIKNDDLKGAFVADKIAGKAAALLYVYGGVEKVYVQVLSDPAEKVLKQNKIKFTSKKKVSQIINRSGTGICPMDAKVVDIDNPREAWALFKDF